MKFEKDSPLVYRDAVRKDIVADSCRHMLQYKKDKYSVPTIFYYLEINNGEAYKIGITRVSVRERYGDSDMKKIKILSKIIYPTIGEAHREE